MNSMVEKRRSEVHALCRRYDVLRLDLFGSAATDKISLVRATSTFWWNFAAGTHCQSEAMLRSAVERQFLRSSAKRLCNLPV